MEEFRNKEYYEKLDEKGKIKYHKLYIKYKQDEEKVIEVIEYEKKIQKIMLPCGILMVLAISFVSSNLTEFIMNGGVSGIKYLMIFWGMAIPVGLDIYKHFFIVRELNKNIAIVISVILTFISVKFVIGLLESIIYHIIAL